MERYARLVLSFAALLLALAPATLAGQADEAPLRIGVIDLDAAAFGSPAGQELAQQLTDFQQDLAAELQARQEAVRAVELRVAEADSLTDDERRVLEREYQDALTAFQRYQQDKQEEATALQDDGRERIRAELAPVIEAIQAELDYDLILNATSPIIILFSERVDITQLVIDRLASETPGSS
jgi:Skp family chaperone for outer membrane proteins